MKKSRWEQLLMSLNDIIEIMEENTDITFEEVDRINESVKNVIKLFEEYEKPDDYYFAWKEMLEYS